MSSAIEVLKKYSTSCSVCKYDSSNQCKASEGEFGECKPAEELSKAINKALLALEKQEKLIEWLEKEIIAGRIKQSRAQTQGENVRQTISMTRLKALREVKEKVGEQK